MPFVALPLVLLLSALSAGPAVSETGVSATTTGAALHTAGAGPAHPPGAQGSGLPWVDEVRDQRRALAELRRARREAGPDGRLEDFLRRRQERRELIEQERWLFLNYGPWLEPLAPPPAPVTSERAPTAAEQPPPGWDNRWYFNGW